jgi:hypothetical protein
MSINKNNADNNSGIKINYQYNKIMYLIYWKECLGIFLNWPQDQVEKLAKRWQKGLDGLDQGLFYHETAMYYITRFMIPDSITKRIDVKEYLSLNNRIWKSIAHPESYRHGNNREDVFDWKAAKKRVEEILNEYGDTLRNVQYPIIAKRYSDTHLLDS